MKALGRKATRDAPWLPTPEVGVCTDQLSPHSILERPSNPAYSCATRTNYRI